MTPTHLSFLLKLTFSRPVRFLGELVYTARCHVFCIRIEDEWQVTNVRYALATDEEEEESKELFGVPHPDDLETVMEAAKMEVLPAAKAWEENVGKGDGRDMKKDEGKENGIFTEVLSVDDLSSLVRSTAAMRKYVRDGVCYLKAMRKAVREHVVEESGIQIYEDGQGEYVKADDLERYADIYYNINPDR